jgi:hypothetical protein
MTRKIRLVAIIGLTTLLIKIPLYIYILSVILKGV